MWQLLRTGSVPKDSNALYEELLASGYDANGDGQIAVEELAVYWAAKSEGHAGKVLEVAASTPAPERETPSLLITTSALVA